MIRAALLRPLFERVLKIVIEFGLERVDTEWSVLAEERTPEATRAMPSVERILANIKEGFSRAASGN
jgi:hypothetical protein